MACDGPPRKGPIRNDTVRARGIDDGKTEDVDTAGGGPIATFGETAPRPDLSPIDYLTSIYRDESVPRERRMDAAKAVVAYVHPRMTAARPKGAKTKGARTKGAKKPPRRIVVVWGPPE